MINKLIILFDIKNLKQCRCWIALIISGKLVYFVKNKYRIISAGMLQCINNSTRHRTDISLSVASDFSLVTNAAKSDSFTFSAYCLCNRLSN